MTDHLLPDKREMLKYNNVSMIRKLILRLSAGRERLAEVESEREQSACQHTKLRTYCVECHKEITNE